MDTLIYNEDNRVQKQFIYSFVLSKKFFFLEYNFYLFFFSSNELNSCFEIDDGEYKKRKQLEIDTFDFYYLNELGNSVKLPECSGKSIDEFNTFLNNKGYFLIIFFKFFR